MAEPKPIPRDEAPARSNPGGIAARALGTRPTPYLADLNPEQREAVETLDGPVLVLAGAGTGKTRVLTTRIAHILNLARARPNEILSVTFTNKAAREMKERVHLMVGQVVEGMPWMGTFHSIGVKILRRHAELVGLKNNFTILDTDDQIRLLKQLFEAEGLDDKRWPARVFAGLIDGWKNRGLTPDLVPAGEGASFANGKGKKLYGAYQERLKTLNACDFGDLLLECIRLFRQNPEVLAGYQRRFRYILVDEYQDTNVAQYLWLRLLSQTPVAQAKPVEPVPVPDDAPMGDDAFDALDAPRDEVAAEDDGGLGDTFDAPAKPLAAKPADPFASAPAAQATYRKNICCVGDDDQSIYGWRGAEVDNILRFEHDFPGAKVIRLERNYRSTGHILASASHLIAHNEGRLGKTLRTEDVPGEKVQVTACWDSEEEARAVGEEIEKLQREATDRGEDHTLDEIAILVRASFQMREFEDRFVTMGLPYRVIGGPRFYERQEIRDALAYFRVIAQPADDLAFERIVNVPKRGLGDAAVQMLYDYARKKKVPLTEAAEAIAATDEMKPKPRNSLREVMANFARWRTQMATLPHTELAEIVLDEIRLHGYVAEGPQRRRRRPAGEPQGAGALHGGIREPRRLPRAHLAGDGPRQRRERGRGERDDAALGQGAGVRHRVPARLGGRRVPEPAHARRERPRRARGGAPPRPCRPDAREEARQALFRQQPAHPRHVDHHRALALPRRAAGGACRGEGGAGRRRRLRHGRLWRQPVRRHEFRLELRHARLAARAGAQGARRGERV